MLVCSGLFAGGVLTITWDRLPIWQKMDFQPFKADFGHTLRVADKLQPILLIITILMSGIFSFNREGPEQIFALAATAGFVITLLASVVVLVPLQKRILHSNELPAQMYARWRQGHIGRTMLSLVSFFCLVLSLGIFATT